MNVEQVTITRKEEDDKHLHSSSCPSTKPPDDQEMISKNFSTNEQEPMDVYANSAYSKQNQPGTL
jgi:hypothetical protein